MRHPALLFIATFSLTLTFYGCGQKQDTGPSTDQVKTPPKDDKDAQKVDDDAKPTTKKAESSDPGSADIAGRITLGSPIPAPRKLSITKDVETCGAADTIQDITGKDGGVANVVIEVKGVKGDSFQYTDPKDGYVMRQKDCQFKPNLLVVPFGKEIKVYNDDPVGHNVNTGDWNQMQPAGPDPIVRPVENKAPTKIGCNIHSWMEAWIYPVQNPYFAVTDEQGNFQINGIPPGKYRVNIWHPSLGRKTERMTLKAGESEQLDHEFTIK